MSVGESREAEVCPAHGDPAQYATPIRRALAEIDPNQPVYQVQPLERLLA